MAKLIGVDTPQTTSSVPQPGVKPVTGVDTSTASLNIAQQAINNTGNFLQQSVQQQSQITQQMTQSSLAVEQTKAQAEMSSVSVNKDNFGGLLKGAAAILDQIDKRDQAVKKAQYDKSYADALREVSKLQVDAQNTMRNEPGGRTTVERRFDDLMTKFNLKSEDRAKVYNDFYSTLQTIEGENARRLREETDKVADAQLEERRQKLGTYLSNDLSFLAKAVTPDEQKQYVDRIDKQLQQIVSDPNLSAKDRQALLTYTATLVNASSFKSGEAQAGIMRKVNNYAAFSKVDAELLQKYQADGDRGHYEAQRVVAADQYDINPAFLKASDPLEMQKRMNEIEQTRQDTVELRKKGEIQRFGDAQFDNLVVGGLAYDLVNNPAELGRFKQTYGDTRNGKAVLSVVETFQKFQEKRDGLRVESASIATAIRNVERDDAEGVLSLLRSMKPESRAGILGSMPWLKDMLGTNLQDLAQQDEGAKAQWNQQLLEANQMLSSRRQEVISSLRDQLRARTEEADTLGRQLQQYGFNPDGTFSSTALDTARKKRNEAVERQRAQQDAQDMIGNGGTTPPFRVPQLKKVNVGGRTAVLPIPTSANVHVWNNYGQDRGTHSHAGEDLAVPKGTPIVAMLDGEVTRVDKTSDPDGYGYFFEVKYTDGTYHLFAHNSRIKVAERQKVSAGQVLALSGGVPGEPGSGRTSGAHIHWEVRDKNERLMNPYSWATTIQSNAVVARARSGDNKQERPVNIPKDAIPVTGGYLVVGSDGKFQFMSPTKPAPTPTSYKPSSPLRYNANSTNIKDYPKRNNPDANYGYSVLAQDKQFAAALAKTADRIGIPAQWLADVIAHETDGTFDPRSKNYGGAPASGLLHFYDDEDRPGGKTIGGRWYSRGEMEAMTRTQQLRLVEDYLRDVGAIGNMKEPGDLASAVYTGAVGRPDSYGGAVTLGQYKSQMGRHAGRRYYDPRGNRQARAMSKVDTRPNDGCTLCQQMLAQGDFIPHERVA
ncbi:endopeptidase [Leptolyngbya phage Lsp-JY17]